MSAQDRTLDRYQELMQINAASHVLRAAREIGLFDALRTGQKTVDQLAEMLGLRPEGLSLLVDCLISMNVIERYEDDHALAPVMQLLCQYDGDLGDSAWQRLAAQLRTSGSGDLPTVPRDYLDGLAATQWVHTPAAMQVAEMLDLAGNPASSPESDVTLAAGASPPAEQAGPPLRILDLGCGSAVWSSAMAYSDGRATVLAVDAAPSLAAARSTADSIQLGSRFQTEVGDPESIELPEAGFDLVVIAQRLHAATPQGRDRLLDQARRALAPGGRIVLIDLFRGPARPRLSETIEALRVHVAAPLGGVQSAEELRQRLLARGLNDIRFSFIAASRVNLGVIVAAVGDR